MNVNVPNLIHKKRNGEELTKEEIRHFIADYTEGEIPDYQMAAFAMAVYFRGMTDEEILYLTKAMEHSGDTLDLSEFGDFSVDKHSTGGVGDKTSLIVGPIVSSLGGKFAKMSGRGLGHTGGTVDKLDSIPGYNVTLSEKNFLQQVRDVGIAIVGQSGNLTPADKKLYALRDVTDTVDALPLIVSSIMSKKLAAGAKNLVLDVKVGAGGFIPDIQTAKKLAEKMVAIGKRSEKNVAAVLTDMNAPLGYHIGNALEVIEAAEVLQGRGSEDLKEVSFMLAAQLVSMMKKISHAEAEKEVKEAVESGAAFEQMKKWVAAQGGDPEALTDYSLFPQAAWKYELQSKQSGYLKAMDARLVGKSCSELGAGRRTKKDKIDLAAGIVLKKKPGDYVQEGETIAVLHTNQQETISEGAQYFEKALVWSDEKPRTQKLIYGVVE